MRIPVLLSAILACLAAAPGQAAAKPGYVVHHPRLELSLFAAAANGYWIAVFANSPGKATVMVESAGAEVTYELPAVVKRNRLEVHYGDVIDISARFRPGSRRSHPYVLPHEHCVGREPTIVQGEFIGRIEFHGERGYTELVTTRHKGTSERTFRRVCRRAHRAGASSAEAAPVEQLVAVRAEAGAETWFQALANFPFLIPHPRWGFEAKRAERRGPVKIQREVLVEAEAGATFSTAGSTLESAAVEPSAPFSGKAEYSRGAGGGTWVGSLAVELPGLPPLPLTGPGFKALACIGEGRAAKPCERSPLASVLP